MARSIKISQEQIILNYIKYILENNEAPKSVYAFAKANNFNETEFYTFFGNFEAIEQGIFKAFFDNTITTLEKSKEYRTFDARNKLLSFYYTFFENLTANRSYILIALNSRAHLNKFKVLATLKNSYTNYISELNIETFDFKEEKVSKIQQKTIEESAWMQLLITINFWIIDTSALFEKTDIFIEKSVNTSFDLIDTTPLKSVMDLGKFLFKEKINLNL